MGMESKSKKKRKRNYSSGSGTDTEDAAFVKLEPQSDEDVAEEQKLAENEEATDGNVKKEEPSFVQSEEIEPPISYKVLGEKTFTDLKKIRVTSKWISAGTTFPADLVKENLVKLDDVDGLHPSLMEATKRNVKRWFPVQKAVLPGLLRDTNFPPILPPRDVAISAPTGSGKTLCYVLPVINSLSSWVPNRHLFALIVAPVQSLVVQIENEFNRFNCFNIPTAVLTGSRDFALEKRQLETARVAFATPGRLMEHLFDSTTCLNVEYLRYLVIDEADRMHQNARLEWLDALESAVKGKEWKSPADLYRGLHLQKILVSATLSHDVENLQVWNLRYPRLFRATATVAKEVKQDHAKLLGENIEASILPSSLSHDILVCEAKMKPLAVYTEIVKHDEWKRILVFVNNKLASNRLTILLKALSGEKFNAEELSSNLFGKRRVKVLTRFAKGGVRVLIASDVLSRGVDVQDIDAVFNYDKPQNQQNFVHRVGRTARCGRKGTAISFVTPEEKPQLEKILEPLGDKTEAPASIFNSEAETSLLENYKAALESLQTSVQGEKTGKLKKAAGKLRKKPGNPKKNFSRRVVKKQWC